MAPAHNIVVTKDGTRPDLWRLAPRTVMRYLTDDYAIVSAARSSAAGITAAENPPTSTCGHAVAVREARLKCGNRAVPWYTPIAFALAS